MSSEETVYSIYIKFYAALSNGENIGMKDFYFEEILFGKTPFNEQQIIAASLAIGDYKSQNLCRTKTQLLNEIGRLAE